MSHRWMLAIHAAQRESCITLGTTAYPRIPYGQEHAAASASRLRPCRNCGVLVGQLHVYPCVVEMYPACRHDQRITCEEAGCTAHIRQAIYRGGCMATMPARVILQIIQSRRASPSNDAARLSPSPVVLCVSVKCLYGCVPPFTHELA
jgi:hypothetical protein